MPKEEALGFLGRHFERVRAKLAALGLEESVRYDAWPGDDEAGARTSLVVHRGGTPVLGSKRVGELASKGLARVSWIHDSRVLGVALGAEKGEVTFDSPKAAPRAPAALLRKRR
jgi:hypothetical protein